MLSKYEKERFGAKEYYTSIVKIYSPAFGKDIYFNAQGFYHLISSKGNKTRGRKQQMARFRLLKKAVELISSSNKFELSRTETREKVKKGVKKIDIEKKWFCDGEKDGSCFRVILRQTNNGNVHFLSVIPLGKPKFLFYPFASLRSIIPDWVLPGQSKTIPETIEAEDVIEAQ